MDLLIEGSPFLYNMDWRRFRVVLCIQFVTVQDVVIIVGRLLMGPGVSGTMGDLILDLLTVRCL